MTSSKTTTSAAKPPLKSRKNILIVANCPSKNTRKLQQAVCRGAQHPDMDGIAVCAFEPQAVGAEHILQADGLILGSTENFGYMSGLIKDFFERIYYPCLEKTAGLPVAIYIKGGLDGTGAKNSIEKIIGGLKWKLVQPALVLRGAYQPQFADQCEQLGMHMAAGLDAGIF